MGKTKPRAWFDVHLDKDSVEKLKKRARLLAAKENRDVSWQELAQTAIDQFLAKEPS